MWADQVTMDSPRKTFAVLVDGDNAPADVLKPVLLEVEKHGEARVRLVFGTGPALQGHKENANMYGFRPILQFNVATKKNAADIALAIAAIDLLHAGDIDSFCIVSSDSDFHPLATKLREAGKFVLGIGRDDTPDALKSACHDFVSLEILRKPGQAEAQPTVVDVKAPPKPAKGPIAPPASNVQRSGVKELDHLKSLLMQAYQVAQPEDGWAPLGAIGNQLKILEPGFDARKYGRRQLWMLARDSLLFDFRPDPPAGPGEVLYVRAKG